MKFLEGMKTTKKGGKLLIDVYLKPFGDPHEMKYRSEERITYESTSEIICKGYRECVGFKTELAYYRMPIYMKLHNFKKFDYEHAWTDDYGNPVNPETFDGPIHPAPLDTSTTLCDYFRSAAIANFKKGMISKVSMLPELDIKVIGTICIVAAGIICGIVLLMK